MWLGTHPSGSSSVLRQGAWHSLAETVAADPMAELGKETVKRFGTRLPYLLKLIAVDLPLSLQVHPSRRQAEEGYARGVYVDPFPKPELICALTPFTALAGFRPPREAAALIGGLGVPDLEPVVAPLAAGDASAALHALVEWPKEGRGILWPRSRGPRRPPAAPTTNRSYAWPASTPRTRPASPRCSCSAMSCGPVRRCSWTRESCTAT